MSEILLPLSKKKSPLKRKFFLEGFYLGDTIDLKNLQEKFKKYPYLTKEPPLILKFAPQKYIVITKFGTVVFWNLGKKEKENFLEEIFPFVDGNKEKRYFRDTLKVFILKDIEKVTFGRVFLSSLDKEKIKIISFVLSQSIALERYETEIEEKIKEMERIIEKLKMGKWTGLKEKKLLSQIGEILEVKQKAISHLSLFDKPATTWEREDIEKLYHQLAVEFELEDRFDVLNEKIKFLSDHNKILLDFISAQRSNFLETIIIVLIIVEILIFLTEVFFKIKF